MKIAHIISTFPPYHGGMGNSAAAFARSLSQRGHEVVVFTPRYNNNAPEKEENNGFKIFRLKPLFKLGNAAVLPQLFWCLRDFELVHLHYPFFGSVFPVLVWKIIAPRRKKLIVHYHMDTTAGGFKGLIFFLTKIFVLPLVLRLADVITCASFDYVSFSAAGSYFRQKQKKFREIYFGVDTERFFPAISGSNEKQILFVGGLDNAHYFKGVDVLLSAAARLKDLNFRLNIIGDGDLKPSYEKQALVLGLENKISFLGKVADEDLAEHYRSASVFVLPSINRAEAFGLVLLEAMASGAPVIASDLAGVRRVFEDGRQGFLVTPGSIDDLAAKLKIILSDDELQANFGRAAALLAREKYSPDKVGERLEKAYL